MPMMDFEEMVRLWVEDPGIRFDGNALLQPVLAVEAIGRSRSRAEVVKYFIL